MQTLDNMTSTSSLSGTTYTFAVSADDWFLMPDSTIKLNLPEQSDWECEMFGTNRCMVYRPTKGNEPNWFWRKMQYLCFGNRWVKYDPANRWVKHDSTKNR